MQYHHRSRLPPPPPPPFGRGGGGGTGYPRGHRQLYGAPPPLLAAAPPPQQRKYEVLMEAGRLAAEYLVAKGVLPPSSLQRSGGGAWTAPAPLPAAAAAAAPPPQQQREDPPFYGRRRYDDEYSNNPGSRLRRNSSSSSSSSSRDDYSSGSYNGRGKRKYGDYRRGYSDWGREREREKERGRPGSNGRRYEENDDEDGAPGFRRERRGSGGNDDVRSSAAEVYREATPLMGKEIVDLEMNGTESKAVNSSSDVKEVNAPQMVQSENEEGEMEEDGMVLSLEPEVVELGMDTNDDVNNASVGVDMETELQHLSDGKVPDEKAGDDDKVLVESALDAEATNSENNLHGDERNLLKYCDYAKAPTKRRSSRAQRNATSVQREPAVPETTDRVSFGEASQMVPDEAANESAMTILKSENREDQIYQENGDFSTSCNEKLEPILLEDNKESTVTANIIEEKNDAQLHVVEESKEEINVSALAPTNKDSLMQETDLSPLTASHKDSLVQDNLSPLTDSHKNSLIEETEPPLTHSHEDSLVEETNLSSLTTSHKDSLMQETDLSQTLSSHENNLNLQFREGCDIDMLPQDVDSIELSDQRKTVSGELFSNVGAGAASDMKEENLEQSSPFKICDQNLVCGTEVSAIHNNPLAQCSAEESCTESHRKQQQDFVTTSSDVAGGANNICQLPLDNKGVEVIDIEDDTPIEVGGFDSSKTKSEMICSSMDNMMDPVVHSGDLPGIQDGYNLAISDYLGADIPCYPSMQSDLHAGIGGNDSEGITVMDDPIYGSLTDIGFMDVWGQPTHEEYDKFF
ncbi:hypothetical protein E2562_008744 [Oryza meyeriana var. granulata]|uniref:Uncharacterized protein n=1 Tax=Oryza meyeriana var. granulata TaxID=110450 RepID=A0A6G1F5N9_9ORYZ|nr:hypothetical protein E2562_008744 [Oryza meyeriana var. granulata]